MIAPQKAGFLNRFTNALLSSIQKAGGVVADVTGLRRLLQNKPDVQATMQNAANARNDEQWARACITAYKAKISKVKAGIGRNTLSGIPHWFLKQEGLI